MEAPGKAERRGPGAPAGLLFPVWAILMVTLWWIPGPSMAGAPTEQIRGTIDRAIGILKDPALAAKGMRAERSDLLRKEIAPAFDYNEMAKRSLGPNWRGRTPGERERFSALFRELLENSYFGKIESYQGEEIRYHEETIDGPYAQVKTLVVTRNGQEVPVDYRMLADGDRYRIYDVVIEGISLVNNYRSQFNGILRKATFEEMMESLRATIREQRS